jgi:hypothetical protein
MPYWWDGNPWVSGRDQNWRDQITVVALDPFRGYATALRTSLPQATRVLDWAAIYAPRWTWSGGRAMLPYTVPGR